MRLKQAIIEARNDPERSIHVENLDLVGLYHNAGRSIPAGVSSEEDSSLMLISGETLLEVHNWAKRRQLNKT